MFTVKLNEDEITPTLERLALVLDDMTPVMSEIGDAMVRSTKARFSQGIAPDGTPWAPKSQTTIDAYAARNDGVDFRPLFGPDKRLSSEYSYDAGPKSVQWGSNVEQAAVMQFGARQGEFGKTSRGGPIPWGDIPARPFLGVSEDDRTHILATLGDWLERAAQKRR